MAAAHRTLQTACRRGARGPCGVSASAVRTASTFAYLKPGPAPNLIHELVYDESRRYEAWASDAIPRIQKPDWQLQPAHQRQGMYNKLLALVREQPDTFLVRAVIAKAAAAGEQLPLTEEELAPFLAPPTEDERARVATFAGRMEAAKGMQEQIKGVVHLLRSAEAQSLDAGVFDAAAPYSVAQRQAVARGAHHASALAGARVLRQLSILHAAHIAALPADEHASASREWLSTVGIDDPVSPGAREAHERSPRIPMEMYHTRDAPLDSPMTPSEVRDGPNYLDYEQTKLMVMEHRDRVEVGSRTALPPSLSEGAPNEALAHAASALEANPSLSREDKEYMLQFYADALTNKASAWDVSKEKAAWADPQPQWGFYDPELPRAQDDAKDALHARGRYSAYRGKLYASEQAPPSMIGEAPIYAVSRKQDGEGEAGTPPEVVEEAAGTLQDMTARMAAESIAASAAVTAALERSMGLKPRKQTMTPPASLAGPTFWKRYASGSRVAGSDPAPPLNGPFAERERMAMPTTRTQDAKGDKGGKGGKGGKPAAGAKKK